jgi:hypothetical protein
MSNRLSDVGRLGGVRKQQHVDATALGLRKNWNFRAVLEHDSAAMHTVYRLNHCFTMPRYGSISGLYQLTRLRSPKVSTKTSLTWNDIFDLHRRAALIKAYQTMQ